MTDLGESRDGSDLPLEIVPEELGGYRVVDIREAIERVESPFPMPGADWMPLSEWTGSSMTGEPTLFVCRSGVRSLRLAIRLREEGLSNVYSLPGGVTTLSELITG